MSDVTRILTAAAGGDPHAAAQLLPLVYDELRRLAAARLANEKPGQTLNATALVHEAYLRMVGHVSPPKASGGLEAVGGHQFANRAHFFAAAAEAMRRILVEQARRKGRLKRGGGMRRIDLDDAEPVADMPDERLLALDEALTRFAQQNPVRAELVKLRFFAGLTMPEAAAAIGVSLATAERYWTFAKAWLCAELTDPESPSP